MNEESAGKCLRQGGLFFFVFVLPYLYQ